MSSKKLDENYSPLGLLSMRVKLWKLRMRFHFLSNYNKLAMDLSRCRKETTYLLSLISSLGSRSYVQSCLIPPKGSSYGLVFGRQQNYFVNCYLSRLLYLQEMVDSMCLVGERVSSKQLLQRLGVVPPLMTLLTSS